MANFKCHHCHKPLAGTWADGPAVLYCGECIGAGEPRTAAELLRGDRESATVIKVMDQLAGRRPPDPEPW